MNENSAARGGLLDDQNSNAIRMNAQSEVATCALPEAVNNPLPKLAKSDTVALWHAVGWMELCLRHPPKDGENVEAYQTEKECLRIAKQALRKVNKIKKEPA
ncbi:hypothetical protein G7048_15480 [Diaphorobacter sp. HDW4B]|uniref:hypothetical protein n=1 Tax=Diaphorobacter sp. HDW4B TaxID=2714925 RepID=UPI00140CA16C|nr:hypothetical protein [Diaphorobacter sp. HDW4B]QIL71631.1 hypothetical protein G7048_15480 [Diaphorobacter sp. HDW4B]